MGKPMYEKGVDFKELDRPWWPKSIWYRHYITEKPMVFQTKVIGYTAEITRKSDGRVLARLEADGKLYVYPGYYWDGPSGPTFDTIAFIIASLPHDILYQMLREDKLINVKNFPSYPSVYYKEFYKLRRWADDTMKEINLANGMSKFRAAYTYKFVRWFGEPNALSRTVKLYSAHWSNS